MADKHISDLISTSSLNSSDLLEIAQTNAQSVTGYSSRKINYSTLNTAILNTEDSSFETSDKSVKGAIRELSNIATTVLTGTPSVDKVSDSILRNKGRVTLLIYKNRPYIVSDFDSDSYTAFSITSSDIKILKGTNSGISVTSRKFASNLNSAGNNDLTGAKAVKDYVNSSVSTGIASVSTVQYTTIAVSSASSKVNLTKTLNTPINAVISITAFGSDTPASWSITDGSKNNYTVRINTGGAGAVLVAYLKG